VCIPGASPLANRASSDNFYDLCVEIRARRTTKGDAHYY
jgi:hypothetical protein